MTWKNLLLWGGLLCLLAEPMNAGAWPRGKGNAFVSSSGSFTWPNGRALEYPDIYGSTYAEYGLNTRLTLGIDIGSSDATRSSKLKAIAFVRYSLSSPQSRDQFAIDIGGGKNLGSAALRIGASYGRGIELFEQSGWVSIDAATLIDTTTRQSILSLDATLGVNLERGKLMGQFSGYQDKRSQRSFTFTPSYAHKLSEKQHVEIGVTFDLSGAPDPALKLGIWRDF